VAAVLGGIVPCTGSDKVTEVDTTVFWGASRPPGAGRLSLLGTRALGEKSLQQQQSAAASNQKGRELLELAE
jgi:hypothetical protein